MTGLYIIITNNNDSRTNELVFDREDQATRYMHLIYTEAEIEELEAEVVEY
jgi:hypothetical protein